MLTNRTFPMKEPLELPEGIPLYPSAPQPPPKDERPQLRRMAHAAQAYGLVRGALSGMLSRCPEVEQQKLQQVLDEADQHWSKFIDHA
jgi:hypothetical protein